MNIREGMRIKILQGARGTVTKVEMQSCNGEVWYDLRIKSDDDSRYEYHGLEKDMYKYFESVNGENLQTVSMSDFKALREQVIKMTEEVKAIKETLNKAVLHTL